MSDRSGSDDEFWNNLDDVADGASSPIQPATPAPGPRRGQKRTATQAGLFDDPDDNMEGSPAQTLNPGTMFPSYAAGTPGPRVTNQNLTAVARRFASNKKLRSEQTRELEEFASDSLSVQNIKIYGRMLAIEQKLEKIIVAQPPFEISKSLATNIASYSNAVFFSSQLAAYRGDVAHNHMQAIVKRMRWVPAGLEHNTADWNKVKTAIQDCITQVRGAAKKLVKASVASPDPLKHMNIFKLTQKLLNGTGCKMTVPVMARVALWRDVFLKHPGDEFWLEVDKKLLKLRKKGTTPEKLTRLFKAILKRDRQKHGEDFELADVVNEFDGGSAVQQEVDLGIEATSRQIVSVDVDDGPNRDDTAQMPPAEESTEEGNAGPESPSQRSLSAGDKQ